MCITGGDGSNSNPYVFADVYVYAYVTSQSNTYDLGGGYYYYGGGDYNGSQLDAGNYNGTAFYSDPYTSPGGAGYYPVDNPGPAPVNGPGLYPLSRQAEVYKFMWDQTRNHGKEQAAYLTDRGIFLLPDTKNTINSAELLRNPGINVQHGYNGQQAFTYKDRVYRIEGIVHTHPPNDIYPNGRDGLSPNDSWTATDYFKAPIFASTDEGIWRGRPGFTPPGELIYSDYLKVFDKDYTISNLDSYK